jgi:two-component system phosphate regulon response regulator PhoB
MSIAKLLRTLIERRGRIQERDRLLNDVWGYESIMSTRTVDTHVRRLRKKTWQSRRCD